MTPDQKLKQAQDDLRRAERAVQEARNELAREKPKFTEADVVPGARFWSPMYRSHVIIAEIGYTPFGKDTKYGLTGHQNGNPFCWWNSEPYTVTDMVDHLNCRLAEFVKTPGKWVFQPEIKRLENGDLIWVEGGHKRFILVRPDGRADLLNDHGDKVNTFDSLEALENHIDHSEKIPMSFRYYRENPRA